ncbi:hypothetical protein AABM34_11690 [Lysinibacillus fusiformis]
MTIINLMQAYELDKLSKLNFSDEEILRALRAWDVSAWQEQVPNYDFSETMALFQGGEQEFLDALHGSLSNQVCNITWHPTFIAPAL